MLDCLIVEGLRVEHWETVCQPMFLDAAQLLLSSDFRAEQRRVINLLIAVADCSLLRGIHFFARRSLLKRRRTEVIDWSLLGIGLLTMRGKGC